MSKIDTKLHWEQTKAGILANLLNKKTIKGQVYADCPFCDHKTVKGRGFTVKEVDGVYFCHKCGKSGNSLTLGAFFRVKFKQDQVDGEQKFEFEYVNSSGEVVGKKTEYRAGGDLYTGKRTRQFWSKLSGTIWIDGKPTEACYYGQLADTVYIVEGEKKVNALRELGLPAITQGGCKNWKSELNYLFENRRVFILVDCDKPGREFGNRLALDLLPLAQSVKVLDIDTNREDGFDIADYYRDFGHGKTKWLIDLLTRQPGDGIQLIVEDLPVLTYSPFSDSANSERLAYYYGDKIRYSRNHGWLIWDSTRWAEGKEHLVVEFAKNTSRVICEELRKYSYNPADKQDSKEIEKWNRFIQNSQNKNSISNCIELAKSIQGINLSSSKLDSKDYKLNLINGTYNFETGRLEPHSQDDLITKRVSVVYNSNQYCANWVQFLNEIFDGDSELIRYIQKLVGLSLTGNTDYQAILFLYGTGKNGKSVFVETIKRILGDYSTTTPTSTLMARDKTVGATPDLAALFGKRAVFANETSEGTEFNEELIKSLTGGDEITVRRLYSEPFSFKPVSKLWIIGNHKPTIRGNDTGIKRRVKLIPFKITIALEQLKERSYFDKVFGEELSGILNWAIEGFKLYRQEGIKEEPLAVSESTKEYLDSQDLLQLFANDCLKFEGRASKKELYSKYCDWCEDNGLKAKSNINFRKQFLARFPEVDESRSSADRYYIGVSV